MFLLNLYTETGTQPHSDTINRKNLRRYIDKHTSYISQWTYTQTQTACTHTYASLSLCTQSLNIWYSNAHHTLERSHIGQHSSPVGLGQQCRKSIVRQWIVSVQTLVRRDSFYSLHGMQTRSSDENFVCPSVRQTRALWQNGRKISPDFYTIRKII